MLYNSPSLLLTTIIQRRRFWLVSSSLPDHPSRRHARASPKAKVLPGTLPPVVSRRGCPVRHVKLTCRLHSNTTAYPRSYVGPVGPATVYPFQANLARVDTAIVFVTKYSREGYDLHDLKVSLHVEKR